jgi:hypothetical protein
MSVASLNGMGGATNGTANLAASTELVERLRHRVRDNSRRWKTLIALEAAGFAIAAPLAYLWLVFLLDCYFHLPLFGRLVASLGLVGSVVWVSARLTRRWRTLHLTEDQVALAIERRTPGGVQNRLINAVQIARGAHLGDGDLSEAVVRENYHRLQQLHLEQAAQVRPALLRMALALALILFGLGFWLFLPDHFVNAAARILLPLADIQPLYRTILQVEPGNIEARGNITITVTIRGERPKTITVLKSVHGKRTSEIVPVEASDTPVLHTFHDVDQDMDYAVRGGDFSTPYYNIEVPRHTGLSRVKATLEYPAYTGLDAKTSDSTGGDLEALQGTRAQVTFVFDLPVDQASLKLDRPASAKQTRVALPLEKLGPREFRGDIIFDSVLGYRLETLQGERPAQLCGPYSLRVLKDQEPKLELTGLERRAEVQVDSVLPVQASAGDDYGLESVGLFFRKAGPAGGAGAWQSVVVWPANRKTSLRQTYELALDTLKAVEGEKFEVALRAKDTDPQRKDWTTGNIYELIVGGDSVVLQVQYERIVKTEAELRELIQSQEKVLGGTAEWVARLSGKGDLRWDDPKNIDALHAGVKQLGKDQDQVRRTAGQVARDMLAQTGNLRIALGMLADTEMIRIGRILDAVPTRDQPQAKRAALADARLTQERTLRSLQEIFDNYGAFRADWELSHLIPFTKMLAERQAKLAVQSKQYVAPGAGRLARSNQASMGRRQDKLLDLCRLIQPAFGRTAERIKELEPTLANAFADSGKTMGSDELEKPMRQGAEDALAGRWSDAARNQDNAAVILTTMHGKLRQAQIAAAQQALAALRDKAKSNIEAQKELEKLPPGSADSSVKDFDLFKVEDTVRLREVLNAEKSKANPFEELDLSKTKLTNVTQKQVEYEKDPGVRQDTSTLTLGKEAEKTGLLPMYKGMDTNKVKPFMQEKFDDLVGKLLDEADELSKNYQSIKLSTNHNNNDPGDIAKMGGSLNSTGALAATGNKKPPLLESGGLARTGRQGARSYGMLADDGGVDRRGRDKALDGKLQAADQGGLHKMTKGDDPQKDLSTGIGGKKVESDDNHFSLHDAGKWKDDMVKRMEKPQKTNYIVERQGDKIDHKVAALLRDLNSKQEQVIERIKAIKKELKNLYLPTEHLDELAANLEANLHSLRDRPDAELFRVQLETLDKLRGALKVFNGANTGFQPSLPRERAIRGRVLDEPSRLVIPGYEEAVKNYYKKLATQ